MLYYVGMEFGRKININKLYQDYINTLFQHGEFVPGWMFFVKFVYGDNERTYADPENNKIYYGKNATPHSIIHELEHLRARHEEPVLGFNEEFEKYVSFYYVGFRKGGCEGLFLEEAFNELSARYWYLKLLGDDVEKRKQALEEYRNEHYYEFEIYTCIGLCLILGLNVDETRRSRNLNDTSCQEIIQNRVTELTGDEKYWSRMQMHLDCFEYLKRIESPITNCNNLKKETLEQYYEMAYKLLYVAFENKKISVSELNSRIEVLDRCAMKSARYFAEGMKIAEDCKNRENELFCKKTIKNQLWDNVNRLCLSIGSTIRFAPAKKSTILKAKRALSHTFVDKKELEDKYGLA